MFWSISTCWFFWLDFLLPLPRRFPNCAVHVFLGVRLCTYLVLHCVSFVLVNILSDILKVAVHTGNLSFSQRELSFFVHLKCPAKMTK